MRLVIERDVALRALKHTCSVADRSASIPMLGNILLSAKDGVLTLTATDLVLWGSDEVECDVGEAGASTVSADRLRQFVEGLPAGGQLALETEPGGGRLAVRCGRARCLLPTLPAGDFPGAPAMEPVASGSLPAGMLRRIFERTLYAVSTLQTKPAMCGVHLHIVKGDDGEKLRAAATDGMSLAYAECTAPEGLAAMPGVTIPAGAVVEFLRLLDGGGDVQVSVQEGRLQLACGAATIVTKLIDFEYPNYPRVIPTGQPHTLTVGREGLEQAMRRLRVVYDDRKASVRLSLAPGRLGLTAASAILGAVDDELEAATATDPGHPAAGADIDVNVRLNAKRVEDVLARLDGDQLLVRFTDKATPLTFHDPKDANVLMVVAPQLA